MKQKIIPALLILLISSFIFSCKQNNTYEKMRKDELKILDAYISEQNQNYDSIVHTSSGLYFIDIEKGVGDTIRVGDKVQIFYDTWALTGINDTTNTVDSFLIDESEGFTIGHRYEPYELTPGTGGSISGLEEGVTYMYPGGKAKLIINSELAYGQSGASGVPGFTTLVMHVEIYKVFKAQ